MKIQIIKEKIKCDTVLCNNDSIIKLDTGSYKGNSYLCESCYSKYKNLFKKDNINAKSKQ